MFFYFRCISIRNISGIDKIFLLEIDAQSRRIVGLMPDIFDVTKTNSYTAYSRHVKYSTLPSGEKQFGKVECKEILFRIFEFAKSLHRFTTFALKHFRFLSFPLASNTEVAAVFRLLFQYSSSSHCFNTIRKVSS